MICYSVVNTRHKLAICLKVDRVSLHEEGLFRIVVDGKPVLWISSQAMDLQVR